ncbi:Centrosomal protein [Actinidia chinensis var. chinensis]|uniref:Centrosomal protein n=1 Tax=Actinidia chinensis var. chinensis TaxID=1590841 RepID=A0A2R6RU46_ACTCC|nr:Centrosomal protein [Actinidia chinensis var. chinensis]
MAASNDLQDLLKPFYQRASQAEDRLARLEATYANKKESGNEEKRKMVTELQSPIEGVQVEQISENGKALEEIKKLRAENAKLKYQITHLVRALKEADSKLASK